MSADILSSPSHATVRQRARRRTDGSRTEGRGRVLHTKRPSPAGEPSSSASAAMVRQSYYYCTRAIHGDHLRQDPPRYRRLTLHRITLMQPGNERRTSRRHGGCLRKHKSQHIREAMKVEEETPRAQLASCPQRSERRNCSTRTHESRLQQG